MLEKITKAKLIFTKYIGGMETSFFLHDDEIIVLQKCSDNWEEELIFDIDTLRELLEKFDN